MRVLSPDRLFITFVLSFLTTATAWGGPVDNFVGQNRLRVAVLAVGLGEAILVSCPDRKTQLLIDGGDTNHAYPGAEQMLLAALQSQMGEDKEIELLLLSHPHPDHIGGVLELLRNSSFRVASYVGADKENPESTLDEELRAELLDSGATRLDDETWSFNCPGTEVKVEALRLPQSLRKHLDCPRDLNSCSSVVSVVHGKVSFLLMADAGTHWQKLWLKQQAGDSSQVFPPFTVLKVAHHASPVALQKGFLNRISPSYAVFSIGERHKGRSAELGYPDFYTLKKLSDYFALKFPEQRKKTTHQIWSCKRNANSCSWVKSSLPPRVFATSVHGTVVFESDGREVKVSLPDAQHSENPQPEPSLRNPLSQDN
jgi:competence protein ComEC